jgi:glycosyltransferase involved in cell wall biosynthesis
MSSFSNKANTEDISVSICAPIFNESLGIGIILETWQETLRAWREANLISKYEIVLCDDKSTDGTYELIKEKAIEHLKIIKNKGLKGAGSAVSQAIRSSRYDYIITIDTDGQFSLDEVAGWFSELNNVDCVLGWRKKNDAYLLKLGSRASTYLMRLILRKEIKDANCMLKLMKADIIRNVDLRAVGMNYSGEMTYCILTSPCPHIWKEVSHRARFVGKNHSKFFTDGFKRLSFLLYLLHEESLVKRNVLSPRRKD